MLAGRSDRRHVVAWTAATLVALALGFPAPAAAAAVRTPMWQATVNQANGALASSTVVDPSGATVFVGGQTEVAPHAFIVAAYDVATGAQSWLKTYRCASDKTRACIGATLALTSDGTTLFLAGEIAVGRNSGHWIAMALDPATGSRRWSANVAGYSYPAGASVSVVVSPVGDRLFLLRLDCRAESLHTRRRGTERDDGDGPVAPRLRRLLLSECSPRGFSSSGARVFTAVGEAGKRDDLRVRALFLRDRSRRMASLLRRPPHVQHADRPGR